jgi:hypothetical protein
MKPTRGDWLGLTELDQSRLRAETLANRNVGAPRETRQRWVLARSRAIGAASVAGHRHSPRALPADRWEPSGGSPSLRHPCGQHHSPSCQISQRRWSLAGKLTGRTDTGSALDQEATSFAPRGGADVDTVGAATIGAPEPVVRAKTTTTTATITRASPRRSFTTTVLLARISHGAWGNAYRPPRAAGQFDRRCGSVLAVAVLN